MRSLILITDTLATAAAAATATTSNNLLSPCVFYNEISDICCTTAHTQRQRIGGGLTGGELTQAVTKNSQTNALLYSICRVWCLLCMLLV